MTDVTKILHRQNYSGIDAAAPAQSHAGKTVLITGSAAGIGHAAAEAYINANASTVIITSRTLATATKVAAELSAGKKTKVVGLALDLGDRSTIPALWESLAKQDISVDVLILNAGKTESAHIGVFSPNVDEVFSVFEYNILAQLMLAEAFLKQGPAKGKKIVNVTAALSHINPSPGMFEAYSASKLAGARLFQDLSCHYKPEDVQIINVMPGCVVTQSTTRSGINPDWLGDNENLPGNFYVWASTDHAAYLHGRFVWSAWDVDELQALKPKLAADSGYLKVGLQGVESLTMEAHMAACAQAV